MNRETYLAIREGHLNVARGDYFDARPHNDTDDQRRVFYAGHCKGYDAASEQMQKRIAEPLLARIAELEAQLEKGKQLCREQTATIVDRTKTVLDLEAQLAYAKALADSEGSRAVEYQREARSLRAQRRWNIEEDGNDLLICFDQHEKGDKCEYVRYSEAQQQPLSYAYEKGWREAAKWASRYDLLSDIGSPSYLEKMAAYGIGENK
jgi:hypothetical protein